MTWASTMLEKTRSEKHNRKLVFLQEPQEKCMPEFKGNMFYVFLYFILSLRSTLEFIGLHVPKTGMVYFQ